jgi:hypothetical protein
VSSIVAHSTCRLCGKTFLPPADPIVLNDPTPAWAKFVGTLTTHLAQKHKRELQTAQIQAGEYAGVLSLLNFDTPDAEMQKHFDYVRWKVHNVTTRARVSDERITERVQKIFDSLWDAGVRDAITDAPTPADCRDNLTSSIESTRAAVVCLLAEMRDVIEERGLYDAAQTTAQNGNLAPSSATS